MAAVKIIIVEDELLIALPLKSMLENLGYEVPACYRSGTEFIANFSDGDADIVLMDINLADNMNGVEASTKLAVISSVPVIYITENADEQLRRKAISETNAAYYLRKPFSVTDVCTALDITLKNLQKIKPASFAGNEPAYLLNDHIFIKDSYAFKKVRLDDILYLEADGAYCHLHCKGGRFTFSENLSYFEQKLQFAKELVRVHRSYIINVNHIQKMNEGTIWIGDTEIRIGKTYRSDLLRRFRVF